MKDNILHAVQSKTVVEMYYRLWKLAVGWSASNLSLAYEDSSCVSLFEKILEEDDENIVLSRLLAVVVPRLNTELDNHNQRGLVINLMKAVDKIFYGIHPRRILLSPSHADRKRIPYWLKKYRSLRADSGVFFENDQDMIILKGPLGKRARLEFAGYGDSLEDKFSNVSVVDKAYEFNRFRVRAKMVVQGQSPAGGYSVSERRGRENIKVAPLAEESKHLKVDFYKRSNNNFARYSASEDLDVLKLVSELVRSDSCVDLMVLPEFLVSEADADQIVECFNESGEFPKLLVCGSGATNVTSDGQAYNESRVLNDIGAELWRQRKIQPSGLDSETAKDYNFPPPEIGKLLLEDNTSAEEIVVADIDALGRCVILICQDLEVSPETLLSAFQPDWVFIPILDTGAHQGRWGHQRAFGESGRSHARFVVVSSTALGRLSKRNPDPVCGLMIGPKNKVAAQDNETLDDMGRLIAELRVEKDATSRSVSIAWDQTDGRWKKTTLKGE
ncbi:hypothetical protein LOY24_04125 [Pseudomonas putida]|uniref:hypothetical protein n=1 Tax=Pseudomonas putida TaxID=303 RepID=UPI00215E271E|nr:hypothetical protein [Pseudomonas putida]UVL79334.1 hypothetical protein LOY24_04125 [Pseudomonas putida]